ncbi:unnamed protein product [Caenorhabditis bovis]|uniref:Galactosylgalactosylxylosylprotein 3-beta-glucuronosyltransferase n=1 Tax=Caenorhabditis bovis TaxID=2654633 RepID=A0A8S1F049_9PELO|nr:unnamed protein product [Caenorhabditis bovis]
MSNTLMHVKHIHWIVIEDSNTTKPVIESMLNRTQIPHTYLAHRTAPGYPKRGWYQRSMALKYLRNNTSEILGEHDEGVVYFADDDNSYDIRLFDEYVRNVRVLGMWAVGLVGGTLVEAPHVDHGKVTSFDVRWNAKRMFAIDMAGFAINLRIVLGSEAVFGTSCKRGAGAPETCLLQDMGLTRDDIEPFGYEGKEPREIYVWHTKTAQPIIAKDKSKKKNDGKTKQQLPTFGYLVEY